MPEPPAPSRAFPPPHVPAAPPASHCTKRPRAPPRPPPANGKPVARQRAHLNGPIRRPGPSPSLYGDRGMRALIRPPATAGCPAHSSAKPRPLLLRPRPLPQPRAERGKSAQRRAGRRGGGRRGGAGGAPAPGALPAGGRAGSWSGKFQAGGRVSPALPSHTAPQRRFSPPPDSSRRASQPVRAAPRARCRQRARLPSPDSARRCCSPAARHGAELSPGLDGAVRRLAEPRGAPPLPGGRGGAHIVLAARPSPLPPPPSVPLSSLPRSLLPSSPVLYKSPAPADPPTAGDPGTLAPGAGSCCRLRTAGTLRSRR